jgi:hypothetical protein
VGNDLGVCVRCMARAQGSREESATGRFLVACYRFAFVRPWLCGCRALKTEYLHVCGSADLLQCLCLCYCSGLRQPIPFLFMESSCVYGETVGFLVLNAVGEK